LVGCGSVVATTPLFPVLGRLSLNFLASSGLVLSISFFNSANSFFISSVSNTLGIARPVHNLNP